MVTLTEPGATNSEPSLLTDSPRSIPLVPGRNYKISCEGTGWRRDGEVVPETTLADGVSGVYVVSSGNVRILMLQLFSEDLVGEYVCRNDGSGEEFIINISTGIIHTCRPNVFFIAVLHVYVYTFVVHEYTVIITCWIVDHLDL